MIITIDGPAGSGKSTVAKKLAEKLDIYYLYTGLLYRAVAYILINNFKKKLSDLELISPKDLEFIKNISYEYYVIGKEKPAPQIFYDNENLTVNLYRSDLDQSASIVSAIPVVREFLLEVQQNIASKYSLVADGRDCGSVVFPKADYKFYLTADLDSRASRIFADSMRKNSNLTLKQIKKELQVRDKRDMERSCAPLTIPNNAIIIDNSNMTIEQTLDEFLRFIKK
ncbi:(d)CMP kinase [Candidatus Babeliales bacterium]|nr:(d)CMP kinase [Candidatus Babeliales bacterium]MCF7899859.1 (d)CMP kinase [Candidatus Babeliales bacterium]